MDLSLAELALLLQKLFLLVGRLALERVLAVSDQDRLVFVFAVFVTALVAAAGGGITTVRERDLFCLALTAHLEVAPLLIDYCYRIFLSLSCRFTRVGYLVFANNNRASGTSGGAAVGLILDGGHKLRITLGGSVRNLKSCCVKPLELGLINFQSLNITSQQRAQLINLAENRAGQAGVSESFLLAKC